MSNLAALSASLVNMKNIGTHKSVALTIHVPEELAQRIIDIFGWPTMSSPVPVAIARLNETPVSMTGQDGGASPLGAPEGSRPAAPPSATERRSWSDLRPSQQSAIRCGEERFRRWIGEPAVDDAASWVRHQCGIKSRRDLDDDKRAAAIWGQIDLSYMQAAGLIAEARR